MSHVKMSDESFHVYGVIAVIGRDTGPLKHMMAKAFLGNQDLAPVFSGNFKLNDHFNLLPISTRNNIQTANNSF